MVVIQSQMYTYSNKQLLRITTKKDEKTEREAEEYLHKQFDEEIARQERLIIEQKLKSQTIGVGIGVLWRMVNTSPLTKDQESRHEGILRTGAPLA